MENRMYVVHSFNSPRNIYYLSDSVKSFLSKSLETEKPEPPSVNELIQNSDRMSIEFPDERQRIKWKPEEMHSSITEEASSTHPIILDNALVLYCNFLEHKLKYGTEIEKGIYTGMTIEGLVERLLVKRCIAFFGKKDRYLLRSGEKGNGDFRTIGTDQEKPPLVMRDYLTWDEIKLSSFIAISSVSRNHVTIGISGPQLDRKGLLDYQDIIIGKAQNCQENGYGHKPKKMSDELEKAFNKRSIWDDFYGFKTRIYGQFDKKENRGHGYMSVKSLKRYVKVDGSIDYCDCYTLEKRYSAMITLFLAESNARAAKLGKMAYIWVNKNRMGLDKITEWQEEYFLRSFVSAAVFMFYRGLHSVYCIHFENFAENCWVKDDTILNNNLSDDPYFWNKHPNKGIKMRLSPTTVEKTTIQEDESLVYVSTYTANANSLPGNEYWMKKFSSNKDSTAYQVCHSFISELHNPLVNQTMLSGQNLHIATENSVPHISEYAKGAWSNG